MVLKELEELCKVMKVFKNAGFTVYLDYNLDDKLTLIVEFNYDSYEFIKGMVKTVSLFYSVPTLAYCYELDDNGICRYCLTLEV